MLWRAERTSAIAASAATSATVGPGSYDTQQRGTRLAPTAAFAAPAERRVLPVGCGAALKQDGTAAAAAAGDGVEPRDSTPPAGHPLRRAGNKSSGFASTTRRFDDSKEAAGKPGPGAYTPCAPSPRQRRCSTQRSSSPSAAAAAAAAAVLLPGPLRDTPSRTACCAAMSSPPSIPARHQALGYELADGKLVQRPPPPPPAAASGGGPRTDSQHSTATTSSSKAATRTPLKGAPSSSTAKEMQRQLQQQQQQQQPPAVGPGRTSACRWRPTAGGKLVVASSVAASGSAAFASTAPRMHQMEPDPDTLTPGPGAYTSGSSSSARPRAAPGPVRWAPPPHRVPVTLFARSTGRAAAPSAGPGRQHAAAASGPGPGAYTCEAAAASRSSVGSRLQLQALAGSSVLARRPGAGFGSGRRFHDFGSDSPGPGCYQAGEVQSLAVEVTRRVAAASKRAALGAVASSTAADSLGVLQGVLGGSGSAASAAGPGPGAYHAEAVSSIAAKAAAAAQRPSLGFGGGGKRFVQPGSGGAINAPLAFAELDDWSQQRRAVSYRVAPFGSESERIPAAATTGGGGGVPGPGSYFAGSSGSSGISAPPAIERVLPGGAGFATSAARFVGTRGGATPAVVGPGSYSTAGSLLRPSHNVTMDA